MNITPKTYTNLLAKHLLFLQQKNSHLMIILAISSDNVKKSPEPFLNLAKSIETFAQDHLPSLQANHFLLPNKDITKDSSEQSVKEYLAKTNVPVLNLNDFYTFFKNQHTDKSKEYTFVFITDCKFAFLYSSIKELGNVSVFFIWLEQKGKFNEFVQARVEIDKFIRFKTIPDLEKFAKDFKVEKNSKKSLKRASTSVSPSLRKTLDDSKDNSLSRTSKDSKIQDLRKTSASPNIARTEPEELKALEVIRTERVKTETIKSDTVMEDLITKRDSKLPIRATKTFDKNDIEVNELPAARHLDDSQSQIVQPMEGSIKFETLINNFRESQLMQREDLSEYNDKIADPQSFRFYYESRINMLNELLPKQTDMMRNLIDTNLSFEKELHKLKSEYSILLRTVAKSKNSINLMFCEREFPGMIKLSREIKKHLKAPLEIINEFPNEDIPDLGYFFYLCRLEKESEFERELTNINFLAKTFKENFVLLLSDRLTSQNSIKLYEYKNCIILHEVQAENGITEFFDLHSQLIKVIGDDNQTNKYYESVRASEHFRPQSVYSSQFHSNVEAGAQTELLDSVNNQTRHHDLSFVKTEPIDTINTEYHDILSDAKPLSRSTNEIKIEHEVTPVEDGPETKHPDPEPKKAIILYDQELEYMRNYINAILLKNKIRAEHFSYVRFPDDLRNALSQVQDPVIVVLVMNSVSSNFKPNLGAINYLTHLDQVYGEKLLIFNAIRAKIKLNFQSIAPTNSEGELIKINIVTYVKLDRSINLELEEKIKMKSRIENVLLGPCLMLIDKGLEFVTDFLMMSMEQVDLQFNAFSFDFMKDAAPDHPRFILLLINITAPLTTDMIKRLQELAKSYGKKLKVVIMSPNTVKYEYISLRTNEGKPLKLLHSVYYMERTQQVLSTQRTLTSKLSMEERLKIKTLLDEIIQE